MPRKYPLMAERQVLSFWLWCPYSGVMLDGQIVPPHKIVVSVCKNQTLYARCPNHQVLCFTSDLNTIKQVMSQSSKEKLNAS